VSDKAKLGFLKIEREKKTEHVTRGSTIGALDGNVNINVGDSSTDGTFRNIASDVVAGTSPVSLTGGALKGNININAKNIEISDAIHQSMNEYDSLALNFRPPVTVSLDFQSTDYTVTTHQSSNLLAGGNLTLNSIDKLTVTGSNLIADDNVNLNARDIAIQNGLYTDTFESSGGSLFAGVGPGYVTLGASANRSEGSFETLTPSLVSGQNVNINSTNSTTLQASIVNAENVINITAPKLDIHGEYEKSETESHSGNAFVMIGTNGPVGGGASASYEYSKEGDYQNSVLSGGQVNLNSGNQTLDGVVINGNEINPHEDYSDGHKFSGGFSYSDITGNLSFIGTVDGITVAIGSIDLKNPGAGSQAVSNYASQGQQLPLDQVTDKVDVINETLNAVDKARDSGLLTGDELLALDDIQRQLESAKEFELLYGTSNSRQITDSLISSSGERLNQFIPEQLPQAALDEMKISFKRFEIEGAHALNKGLSNIPIAGIAFGLIDSFIYANQGTAYPHLQSVGITNQQNFDSLINAGLSSLPLGKMINSSSKILTTSMKQLQSKFKHAIDFGVQGNYSKLNVLKFNSAINQHINSGNIKVIKGTYHGQAAVHYLDPSSGLNVIAKPNGQFWSGWKLSPEQLLNVLKFGKL
ncbi:MAG: hemagglutinin repeat-containing protein, partial [Candidatus Caenarcaniphilales bacterium]|nr:hemagglutinin repeat-containing protein [Candidatus Caenarcaniphilales bacterium]